MNIEARTESAFVTAQLNAQTRRRAGVQDTSPPFLGLGQPSPRSPPCKVTSAKAPSRACIHAAFKLFQSKLRPRRMSRSRPSCASKPARFSPVEQGFRSNILAAGAVWPLLLLTGRSARVLLSSSLQRDFMVLDGLVGC